eukprot:11193516-Lingulodinium_polyedra.AAC.1
MARQRGRNPRTRNKYARNRGRIENPLGPPRNNDNGNRPRQQRHRSPRPLPHQSQHPACTKTNDAAARNKL